MAENLRDDETVLDQESDYGSDYASDDDYGEDFYADFRRTNNSTKKSLIPESVDDELAGSQHFCEQFIIRYSDVQVPDLHVGTLSSAFQEAFRQKSVRDNKILALYLNHDENVVSNIFCTQILCNPDVGKLLQENFVVWGWDLTFRSNQTLLENMLRGCVQQEDASYIASIPHYKLPSIIIILKFRYTVTVFKVIHADTTKEELLEQLNQAISVYRERQSVEIVKEDERLERELLRQLQDQEYQESLRADMEKERVRKMQEEVTRLAEEARQQKEKELQEEMQRLKSIEAEEKAKQEAFRKQIEATLPAEPSSNHNDILRVKFRLPNGNTVERRFKSSTTLEVLLNYLIVEGYPLTEYKVISSWPRRVISSLDCTKTLKELQFSRQEALIVQQL